MKEDLVLAIINIIIAIVIGAFAVGNFIDGEMIEGVIKIALVILDCFYFLSHLRKWKKSKK